MRSILIGTILLSIAAAYYIYLPLPSTISEPWKLMFMDAMIRGTFHLSFVAHDLGLSSPFGVVKYLSSWEDVKSNKSRPTVRITEASFGGVEALVFESTAEGQEQRLKRGVVYFHGGGWTLCSTKMKPYFPQCMAMAEELDAVVISVEYRLAPDGRFPDQYNDVFQASKHILTAEVLGRYSIDLKRVAVSGDSAGGNLAAAVAQQMALDRSVPIKFKVQALVYPALQALDFNTPSYQQNAHIPILHRPTMARFWLEYLNGDQKLVSALLANNHTALDQGQEMAAARAKINWTKLLPVAFQKNYKPVVPLHGDPELLEELPGLLDVRAAPLLAENEVLKGLPPAYIMTCEHDVLRDDGLMYATRLKEAGVRVTVDHYEDGFHGCLSFAIGPFPFSVGTRSLRNYIHWLKENL
ncbi:neutral cholesterol ester hydrolase 1-like [Pimephales promelas]|uniref:neutral cholesterol ester hydrolase 1-like n=1 Tax=Pimephales promelas TaxID=90988 RepID=UPI00195582D5|nr:neutral cholesterol ester hydrolase 1-like [Pimephales promelas]KAG1944091.1 arylacetamide deacetylase [Pimephales promelas]